RNILAPAAAISFLICSEGSVAKPSLFSASGTDWSPLSEFLGLRVDAVHDHCDIHRRVFILRETRKATLLGNSPGLRLHLRIRFVGIRAVVELRHILGGGHEALNMLLGELDLRARSAENSAPRKPPRHGVPLSNERHGLVLYLDTSL